MYDQKMFSIHILNYLNNSYNLILDVEAAAIHCVTKKKLQVKSVKGARC